jgi:hypothetical protein
MKYTCPQCQKDFDVKERRILEHIERSTSFRAKVESLLNSIKGQACMHSMTPAERSERARIAVAAREEKRSKGADASRQ